MSEELTAQIAQTLAEHPHLTYIGLAGKDGPGWYCAGCREPVGPDVVYDKAFLADHQAARVRALLDTPE